MPQCIITKYHGATNFKGSRISARCEGGRVFLHWDDALSADKNHMAAVVALCQKMGNKSWAGTWIAAGLPKGELVWVNNCEWSTRVKVKVQEGR